MGDEKAVTLCFLYSLAQKDMRRRSLPLGIAWRKPLADIAFAQRSKNRVGDCVHSDICVRMAAQAAIMGD